MTRRKVSNPLALAVLALLYERPMHPYEMSSTLRERRKEESIKLNYGSLYSVVESLQRFGLIAVQEVVRQGRRPERTIYAITEAGLHEMIDWLSELVAVPVKEYTSFEAALSLLPVLAPQDAIRHLELRLSGLVHRQRSNEALASASAGIPRIFLIEGQYTQALLDAELAFVRDLLAELRSGALGGLKAWQRLHELRATDLTPEQIDATLVREFPDEFAWLDQPRDEAAGRADAGRKGAAD